MKLIIENNKFKIAFISGPRHNFLSISITTNKSDCNFELNDLSNNKRKNMQNYCAIKEQILSGLQHANKKLNSDFRISLAEYSSLDPFSDHIYHDLTVNIIEKAYSDGYLKNV